MKQHEFKGKDECIHCHGTSSTASECVQQLSVQEEIDYMTMILNCNCLTCQYYKQDKTFTFDYPVYHYTKED